jgi:DNA modification methylase
MQQIIRKIHFHIKRSQLAYNLYQEHRKFYQALRIYKANKAIYLLLIENGDLWNNVPDNSVIEYIFHLEDWFEQFDYLVASSVINLDDEFLFNRFEHSPPFSGKIMDVISNL